MNMMMVTVIMKKVAVKRNVWLHPVLVIVVVIVEVIPLDGSHHFFIKLCPSPQPVVPVVCVV